jgi:hypothetical protein
MNKRQAAVAAGVPPGGADTFAQRTSNNERFKEAFDQMLDRLGLGEERLARVHSQNLEAVKFIVERDRDGAIVDVIERPDFNVRQRAVRDGWSVRGRIGSSVDEEGIDHRPLELHLHYKTVEKLERLVGRKIIDVKPQPVEDQPSLPEVAEPAPPSSSPGDVTGEPPAVEHAQSEGQESAKAEERAEDSLGSLIGAEW